MLPKLELRGIWCNYTQHKAVRRISLKSYQEPELQGFKNKHKFLCKMPPDLNYIHLTTSFWLGALTDVGAAFTDVTMKLLRTIMQLSHTMFHFLRTMMALLLDVDEAFTLLQSLLYQIKIKVHHEPINLIASQASFPDFLSRCSWYPLHCGSAHPLDQKILNKHNNARLISSGSNYNWGHSWKNGL